MGLKTGGPMSVHTLHCTHGKSHLFKENRPLWLVIMDDSAPTYERRKPVKTYKNVLPQNGLWLLKYAGRPTPKKSDKME